MKKIKSGLAALFASAALFVLGTSEPHNDSRTHKTSTNTDIKTASGPTAGSRKASSPKRDNFIATIRELSKKHQYIILGDTSHPSIEINELLADPQVIAAFEADDIDVVIREGPIEQNQGYDVPKYEARPEKTREALLAVYQTLAAKGFLKNIKGMTDAQYLGALNKALQEFIVLAKKDWGWTQDSTPLYSYEFDHHIRERIKAGKAADPQTAAEMAKFMDALHYLKDTAQLPVETTVATILADLKRGALTAGDLYNPSNSPYHKNDPEKAKRWDRAKIDFWAEIARSEIQLYYPDERHEIAKHDLEMIAFIEIINGIVTDDPGYDEIHINALLNKHPELKPAGRRYLEFLKYGASEAVNGTIARNARNFIKDRKAIIVYGFGHIGEKNDLDEFFGQNRSVTICLFAGPSSRLLTSHPEDPDGRQKMDDTPQYSYDISTDHMTKTEPRTAAEHTYHQRKKFYLTREEYEAAVKRLPADLKPFALPYEEYDNDYRNNITTEKWWAQTTPASRPEPGA